jgi:hypothetical protein
MDPARFGLASSTLKLIMNFWVDLRPHSIIWPIDRNYRHALTASKDLTEFIEHDHPPKAFCISFHIECGKTGQ